MAYWVTWDVDESIKNIIGIFATILTIVYFMTPIKTFHTIIGIGSTEAFRGEAYQLAFFNCSLWVLYSLYQGSLLEPLICNIAGGILELSYIILFALYLPRAETQPDNSINQASLSSTTPKRYIIQFFCYCCSSGTCGWNC